MPDRVVESSPTDFPDVEFHSMDLTPAAAGRPERPPFRLTAKQLGIAFCLAIAAGAAFAFWTRPVPPPPADRPLMAMTARNTVPMPAVQAKPAGAIRPAKLSDGGGGTGVRRAALAPPGSTAAPPLAGSSVPAAASPTIEQVSLAPARSAPPPGDEETSFDCRLARSNAEQMVCHDPGLALADRVLAQAYQMALGSGAPRDALRAEQEDWEAIRERAAGYSRDAVADVYAQRIDELRALADENIE